MQVNIPKGKYVLALSGGVDSMVLLDVLAKKFGLELVLAHFNHGIRDDSNSDEEFVVQHVKKYYGKDVIVGHGDLGHGASEESARHKRYEFLYKVAAQHSAKKVVTAHHQDDLIETAFINILRGTGPSGLIAITSNPKVIRPLINLPKKALLQYADEHKLKWREDSTNTDTKYLRNYIRLNVMPNLNDSERQKILTIIENVAGISTEKQLIVATISQRIVSRNEIDRSKFSILPSEIANELVVYWLRQKGLHGFDKATIERTSLVIKTSKAGSEHPIKAGISMEVGASVVKLTEANKCLV
jgi:tRNA(Ile)-lysidine synthetase-like protein